MVAIQIWDIFVRSVLTALVLFVLYLFMWFDLILKVALVVLAIVIADFLIKVFSDCLLGNLISDLSDKAILITGCGSGFGNLLARQLDAKGVTVFAGFHFANSPNALKLKESCSQNLHILQLDVTKDEEVQSAAKTVITKLGDKKFWAVVNNAGIGVAAELEYGTLETMKKTIDINTIGAARVTQMFLPLLRKSKGRVVIMASLAGRLASVGFGSYSMSKFALISYAEILRAEMMRWGVSVHTIEPWGFKTNLIIPAESVPKSNREWQQAPESVKEDYGGDNYWERVTKLIYHYEALSYPETKLHLVTDCLMDAAIGVSPKMKYSPGILGRFVYYLYSITPTSIYDLTNLFLLPKVGDKKKNI